MYNSENNLQADLVLVNAIVWTVDRKLPRAEAVAIRGNEIVAVGRNEEMDPLIGSGTTVYDLEGKLVLPGFNDCHMHFVDITTASATSFSLFGANTLVEIQRRLRNCALDHPEVNWLKGFRWVPEYHGGKWPSRIDLDVVESKRPVAIFDIALHTAWVNTPALKEIGYDADTPDPEGGTILRDGSGHPTGILFENAYEPIPRSPPLSYEIFSEVLRREIRDLNKLGITSISDNSHSLENLEFCARMAEADRLDLRINHWPDLLDGLEGALEIREKFMLSEMIRVVGLKGFLDGAMSNRTAWLLEPYADAEDQYGYPVIDPEEMAEHVIIADKKGFQIITHAIGDRAVREILNIYERAEKTNGKRDSRHRIEHLELIHPEDQKRIAQMNVIASMTPLHCSTTEPDMYLSARIGEHREGNAYAWRNLVDLGVHLCFGTDWPTLDLEGPDPLKQIFMAVTRIPPERPDREPWHLEQALMVEEAIRCYTLEPAYADFMEDRKGSITEGKLADMTVLSSNILETNPDQILETEVVMTIFDGRVVFEQL